MSTGASALTDEQQAARDGEHLRLLAIFFYIVGGITLCFACLGIFHLALGTTIIVAPEKLKPNDGPIPAIVFGLMFAIAGALFVLVGWTVGILTIYAGRCIARRRRRFFVLVMSGVNCPLYPFGTALGIASFIVLSRESVKKLFAS